MRVRLAHPLPEKWLVGRVVQQGRDSVVLRIAGEERPVRLAWADVSAASVSHGVHSHGAAGAAVGGAVGLGLVGLVLTDTELWSDTAPLGVVFAVAALGPTALGALIGSRVRSTRWSSYNPPGVSLRSAGSGRWVLAVNPLRGWRR